jgi:mercuric reductase
LFSSDRLVRGEFRADVPTRVSRNAVGEVVVSTDVAGGTQEFHADQVLVALGRRPVTDGLGLDAVGVKTGDSNQVVVTDQLRSSNPRIWAAGDVTGHPEFVYVAAHHGTLVAENAFADAERSVDYARLPRVTFTGPAIGAVGMTEKQVLAAGIRCDCRVLPLHHVPRALVNRDTRGFIKIVVNAETSEILGLTVVAKDAGELAAAGVHIAEVADSWAPYLTMAEGIRIAAKSFTIDPSQLSCCA